MTTSPGACFTEGCNGRAGNGFFCVACRLRLANNEAERRAHEREREQDEEAR